MLLIGKIFKSVIKLYIYTLCIIGRNPKKMVNKFLGKHYKNLSCSHLKLTLLILSSKQSSMAYLMQQLTENQHNSMKYGQLLFIIHNFISSKSIVFVCHCPAQDWYENLFWSNKIVYYKIYSPFFIYNLLSLPNLWYPWN